MTDEQQIEEYLDTLRASLESITISQREEIVREIGAHIRDSAELPDVAIAEILARLGSPEKLALEYRDGILIRQAGRSYSPFLLMKAAMRVGTRGFFGILVFLSVLFGYVLGGGLILTGFVKPLLPTHVGLFYGPHSYGFGVFFPGAEIGERELLGWWYIPIAITAGSLLVVVTSWIIRRFLRTSAWLQMRLGAGSQKTIGQVVVSAGR